MNELLFLRCTTFIGVCVEFVAAVAWLAELFPNPKQRESVLGYTQAFSSLGGVMVGPRVQEPFWERPGNPFRHGYTYTGHGGATHRAGGRDTRGMGGRG